MEGLELAEHTGRKLHVDFDVEPGSTTSPVGERIPLDDPKEAPLMLSVTYNENGDESIVETEWGLHVDGRWFLVAQHLEAWRHLYSPESAEHLPSLRELMAVIESLSA